MSMAPARRSNDLKEFARAALAACALFAAGSVELCRVRGPTA